MDFLSGSTGFLLVIVLPMLLFFIYQVYHLIMVGIHLRKAMILENAVQAEGSPEEAKRMKAEAEAALLEARRLREEAEAALAQARKAAEKEDDRV